MSLKLNNEKHEPYIIAVKVLGKDLKRINHEFHRRGFFVESVSSEVVSVESNDEKTALQDRHDVVLSLCPRLLLKLCLENGSFKNKEQEELSKSEKLKLTLNAIEILNRAKEINEIEAQAFMIVHNFEDIEAIKASLSQYSLSIHTFTTALRSACTISMGIIGGSDTGVSSVVEQDGDTAHQLDMINAYFGARIALYFGWLRCYTTFLTLPATLGSVLFVQQLMYGRQASLLLGVFCVALPFWATSLQEIWKRTGSEHAFKWDIYGYDEKEQARETVRAVRFHANESESHSRSIRMLGSLGVTCLLLYGLCRAYLLYNAYAWSECCEGIPALEWLGWWLSWVPLLLNATLPSRLAPLLEKLASELNRLEQHPTAMEEERQIIFKQCLMQGVNRYCVLCYTAFVKQDLGQVQLLVTALLLSRLLPALHAPYWPTAPPPATAAVAVAMAAQAVQGEEASGASGGKEEKEVTGAGAGAAAHSSAFPASPKGGAMAGQWTTVQSTDPLDDLSRDTNPDPDSYPTGAGGGGAGGLPWGARVAAELALPAHEIKSDYLEMVLQVQPACDLQGLRGFWATGLQFLRDLQGLWA